MAEARKVSDRADLLIQNVIDYAIYMLDRAGIISSWNTGAERLKGYTRDEIVGRHFSEFYSPEDRAAGKPEHALATALREGRFEAEGWRLRKDGTSFWANVVIDLITDEAGEHIGFAKITRDLSERREAEQALRRSEEHFRLLVEGVKDYAIFMLDPAGHVTSWNAGAERIKGYRREEILGSHFSQFYPDAEQSLGTPALALQRALSEGVFQTEAWRVRKDGSHFWADVVISPIHDAEGCLLGFTKITRDLTERKEAQEALARSREHLFQSQKLEAIGSLTGGVAHDFNNLLAVIMGSLELAQRKQAEGSDIALFIDNALQAARRGATLTQRMLAFARKQDLALEPIDLVDCVRDMAQMLERTIGPQIVIATDFPVALPPVLADRAQFELALMNLAVNARDAMPEGGTITIRGEEGGARTASRFVRISLEDQGEGMDAETLARATSPFFTTKGIGKGSGLGLSMVEGMVEQCGGWLELKSDASSGTTASIYLPVAEAGIATENSRDFSEVLEQPPEHAPPRALRILAVDDDALILMNTTMMLEDLGYEALEAHSGKAALDVLEREQVDLLVTDYAMPGMSGRELIDEARQIHPGIKVIIASGYADLPSGADSDIPRLAKPFTQDDLYDIIEKTAGPAFARRIQDG